MTVLLDLRGVLGGVVGTLLGDAYGAAVREVPPGVPLDEVVAGAGVLITDLGGDSDPAVLTRLLRRHPGLRVLVVEDDGRTGSLWELRPHRIALGELSPQQLIEAVGLTR
ncbi:hypothetical protein FB565_008289 [Actinoplanes lutulentus]|uniref:hypothetical protein n=1 Tax=Actinoplanes lutulentus TaxID=1287878 RepID=UPI000DBA0142|nr:hypothetical protein [Actinoplanes lutulentus]MBB2948506.1 hypothetical protein [Actinoplanes lutulentus]